MMVKVISKDILLSFKLKKTGIIEGLDLQNLYYHQSSQKEMTS